jgi:hypothetical protein
MATFLAFMGGIFWLISICCCSGRSMKKRSLEAYTLYSIKSTLQARSPNG